MKRNRFSTLLSGLAIAALPVLADSISPTFFGATINVGETVGIKKTVTVTKSATAPVDIAFLADTTGSMGGSINAVKTNVLSLISDISMISSDTFYTVHSYNDCRNGVGDCTPPEGTGGSYSWRMEQQLTNDAKLIQAGVNSWVASGGADGPESNLYGLYRMATDTKWRDDSTRLAFWFGDVFGHDPRNGITTAIAAKTLADLGVETYALSVGSGAGLDGGGQATTITKATGGQIITGGYSEVADIIKGALESKILNYSKVDLAVTGLPAGALEIMFAPTSYDGVYDRSEDRDFMFDVMIKGLLPGTYDFSIVARVDGKIVGTEDDRIVVRGDGGPSVPEPSTFALAAGALLSLGLLRKRAR